MVRPSAFAVLRLITSWRDGASRRAIGGGEARRRGAARARALRARRSPLAFLAQELERMRAKVSRQVKTP
jgi:hypothetical protein